MGKIGVVGKAHSFAIKYNDPQGLALAVLDAYAATGEITEVNTLCAEFRYIRPQI
jgi:hypothetical protein